jgi:hypothetical protein
MITKTCLLYDVLLVAVFKHTLSGDKFDEDPGHNYSFLIVFLVDCLVDRVPMNCLRLFMKGDAMLCSMVSPYDDDPSQEKGGV